MSSISKLDSSSVSPASDAHGKRVSGVSGASMDRVVERKTSTYKRFIPYVAAISLAAILIAYLYPHLNQRSLSLDNNRIVVGEVKNGVFEDVIPVRGRIEPARTVYLDAVEGGRVEQVLVEAGAHVKPGDLLLELSNPSLQLEVLGNEARVAEQLNTMRTLELNLEQNRLTHKRNLADIEYQIQLLTRQVERERTLVAQNALAESNWLDTKDTLAWYKKQHALTLESQASDAKMQESQLAFLKNTTTHLENNLAISRKNLDNMKVRATSPGVLSGFDVQVGQSIGRGERLGQVDTPDDFKLTAHIDEFYLDRVTLGQTSRYGDFLLRVHKIYPQVQNGQFRVDFVFADGQPEGIRRGQSLQTRLALGDASAATLLPNGAFYQDTGGNWVFVLTADGSEATRRNVRLGRRNADTIEVLDGLVPGDRVILSSYSGYREMDRLTLN